MTEVRASREGEIREIKVREGDTVRKNQEILIIESPQLSTLILATVPGVIAALYVKTGDWVKAGHLLARIEQPA